MSSRLVYNKLFIGSSTTSTLIQGDAMKEKWNYITCSHFLWVGIRSIQSGQIICRVSVISCFYVFSQGNASTLALLQLESQHSLSSNALHHLMEQLQRRSSYVNFFHPLGPGAGNKNKNSGKPMMAKLKPLTEKDWTQEVETFCGKKMDKVW